MLISDFLATIRDKVEDPLNPDMTDEGCSFSTAELIEYINTALKEVVFRGKLLISTTETLNLVAGTAEYDVPAKAIVVERILDENNERVVKTQEVDLDRESKSWRRETAPLPCNFMQFLNRKLLFYAIPTKASTVTLRLSYVLPDLEASDELPAELSELYYRDLIYWVLYEAYSKPDADMFNPNAALSNKKEFINVFGKKLNADQLKEIIEYPDDPGTLRSY